MNTPNIDEAINQTEIDIEKLTKSVDDKEQDQFYLSKQLKEIKSELADSHKELALLKSIKEKS